MGIGVKLEQLLKEKNKKAGTLATETGISKNTIYAIIKRDNEKVNMSTLEAIAENLGVSVDYFFAGKSKSSLPSGIKKIASLEMKRIPLIGEVAAGRPILADETHDVFIEVDSPHNADYALTIKGDSMAPTYLDGDVVYIREQPNVDEGQVAVVLIDDSAVIKHVYHQKDRLILISDNPAYSPMNVVFEEHDYVSVLGKVVGYTRMYRN